MTVAGRRCGLYLATDVMGATQNISTAHCGWAARWVMKLSPSMGTWVKPLAAKCSWDAIILHVQCKFVLIPQMFVSNHLTPERKPVAMDCCYAADRGGRRTSATSEFIVLHGCKPFKSCISHHLSPTLTSSMSSWAAKSVAKTELQEVYRSYIAGSWLERC